MRTLKSGNKVEIRAKKVSKNASSSEGVQPKYSLSGKAWVKLDWMGYEGLAEAVCSRLLKGSNLNYVEYEVSEVEIDGVEKDVGRGCISRSFTSEGEVFTTSSQLMEKYKYSPLIGSAEKEMERFISFIVRVTGIEDFADWLLKVLEFDYLVVNEDRHYGNIGFIRSYNKSEYRVSPIFDNGLSLLSDTRRKYKPSYDIEACLLKKESKPFSHSFEEQIKAIRKFSDKGLQLVDRDLVFTQDEVNLYSDWERERVANVLIRNKNEHPEYFIKGVSFEGVAEEVRGFGE